MMLGVCGNVIWRCSKLVIRDWRLEISWKVGWLIGLIGLIGLIQGCILTFVIHQMTW